MGPEVSLRARPGGELEKETLRWPPAGNDDRWEGEVAGQSIPHLHWHVGPSLPDDPIRGFNKLGQLYTTEEGKEKVVFFPTTIKLAREDLQAALKAVLAQLE